MKNLHHPGFPCEILKEDLKIELKDLEDYEIVSCSEGFGAFTKNKFFWINDNEKGEIELDFNPKPFQEKGWYFFSPIELEIELTKKCNLGCLHCHNDSSKGNDFELEKLKEILFEFREGGGQKVKFTGGEPLLNKDFFKIIEYSKNLGIRSLELATNANHINLDMAKFIARYFSKVNVSLHGSLPQFHEEITQRKGSFNKTIQGYNNLRKMGAKPSFNYTITNSNKLDIYNMLLLTKRLGNNGIKFSVLKNQGRNEKNLVSYEF